MIYSSRGFVSINGVSAYCHRGDQYEVFNHIYAIDIEMAETPLYQLDHRK